MSTFSEKMIRIVLESRSRILKSCTKRHMLLRVLDRGSTLTLHLVKSFATRTLLLFLTSEAKVTI